MISRQIGATLSVGSGPGFAAFRPSITCASRSGRNTAEPSRFLISPTASASPARRLSSASSSRSTASICWRSAGRLRARRCGVGHRCGDQSRPTSSAPDAARPPPALAGKPSRFATLSFERLQLGLDGAARVGHHLLRQGVLDLGIDLLKLLRHRRLEPGDHDLQFVLAELLFVDRRQRRRRELGGALAQDRLDLVVELLHLGLHVLARRPRACRPPGAESPGRPPAASAATSGRRARGRRSRCRPAASCSSLATNSFFVCACALAALPTGDQQRQHQYLPHQVSSSSAGASPSAAAAVVGVVLDDALQARSASEPSSSAISVTPCVARPSSRISRDARAHQHAAVGDQHDLVLGPHQRGGDDLAVALALLDRDHALGAAAVARVLGDRGALAVAALGGGQHRLAFRLRPPASRSRSARARASCRARRGRCGPSRARRPRRSARPCRRRRTASRRACRRSARRRSGSRPGRDRPR